MVAERSTSVGLVPSSRSPCVAGGSNVAERRRILRGAQGTLSEWVECRLVRRVFAYVCGHVTGFGGARRRARLPAFREIFSLELRFQETCMPCQCPHPSAVTRDEIASEHGTMPPGPNEIPSACFLETPFRRPPRVSCPPTPQDARAPSRFRCREAWGTRGLFLGDLVGGPTAWTFFPFPLLLSSGWLCPRIHGGRRPGPSDSSFPLFSLPAFPLPRMGGPIGTRRGTELFLSGSAPPPSRDDVALNPTARIAPAAPHAVARSHHRP